MPHLDDAVVEVERLDLAERSPGADHLSGELRDGRAQLVLAGRRVPQAVGMAPEPIVQGVDLVTEQPFGIAAVNADVLPDEIAAQQSMSGAVIAPPVSEPVNKEPETDEEKFLQDALG